MLCKIWVLAFLDGAILAGDLLLTMYPTHKLQLPNHKNTVSYVNFFHNPAAKIIFLQDDARTCVTDRRSCKKGSFW